MLLKLSATPQRLEIEWFAPGWCGRRAEVRLRRSQRRGPANIDEATYQRRGITSGTGDSEARRLNCEFRGAAAHKLKLWPRQDQSPALGP